MPRPDPAPGRDYIAVVGASKTGTTGVYATIKHSLARSGHQYACIFEPRSSERLDAPFTYLPDEPLLAKIMIDDLDAALPDPLVFDRRVLTVRDPRDVLISTLLFRPLTRRALTRVSDSAIEEFIAAIARKEQDPGSISVGQLFALARRLGIGGRPYRGMVERYSTQRDLVGRCDFQVVRYENFVAGDLAGLSAYLGFENVTPGVEQSQSTYGHISRSKESGQFRHWFLPADLERFNETFADALATFGYDPDVALADSPTLDPATGSEYLLARFRQRRQALHNISGARDATADLSSPAAVARLADHAGDGSVWACLRVAQAYQAGNVVARDHAVALHWARRAARLGLPEGMQLAAELLAEADSSHAAAHRERHVWQVAATGTAGPASGQVAVLRHQLGEIKRSAAMQVGTQLARAAGNPRHEAVPALRTLARLWRDRRAARRSAGPS